MPAILGNIPEDHSENRVSCMRKRPSHSDNSDAYDLSLALAHSYLQIVLKDVYAICTRRRSVVPPGVNGTPHTTTILSPFLAVPLFIAAVLAAEKISVVVESFLTWCG
jgi:hypothetical protein